MKRASAVFVADRFPALRHCLLELLGDLSRKEWDRETVARLWSVKDIVAHLLGGDIGILSRQRDAYRPAGKAIEDFRELVQFINNLNDQWVQAARRMSPRVLCELLAFTGPLVESYFGSLDLLAVGEPVSWAGPDPAPVWLDVAREFTERWHHQQQIRDATARPPLYAPYFLAPVLDTFVRALPYSFRDTVAAEGTVVKIGISGEAGGCWFLQRENTDWQLCVEADRAPSAEVTIPQDAAWRLFTKGIRTEQARSLVTIRGESSLVSNVFRTVAVIA